jgi:hypothetical protein
MAPEQPSFFFTAVLRSIKEEEMQDTRISGQKYTRIVLDKLDRKLKGRSEDVKGD